MNCKGVIREISNYLDGELEATVKVEIERHLEHCEDCTMVVDQTKKTIEIFCDSEPVALPENVRSRLHDAIRQKLKRKGD